MSKITLNQVANLQDTTTSQTTINNNSTTVQTAFDNTLSRDGTTPNQMGSNLDMNNFQVLNLPPPNTTNSPLRLQDLNTFIGGGSIVSGVASVGLGMPADFTVSGSPVTSTGTLTAAYATPPTGTGAFVKQTSPTLITPVLGVPSSGTLTNCSSFPVSGLTGLGANVATFLATPTTANLQAAVTGETGTGAVVFGTNPTLSGATMTNTVLNSTLSGTGFVSAATPSTAVGRDSSGNSSFSTLFTNNLVNGYTTTATTGVTTTLVSSSAYNQIFTGTSTQTVILPVTSTLFLGFQFFIQNNSTGNVTVQSSGANNIVILPGGTAGYFTCILTSGTTAASWTYTSVHQAGQILATATNDSANPGNIGELISSTVLQGSPVSLTTATNLNVTSISVTPGDWWIFGTVNFTGATTTTVTFTDGSISTTSATVDATPGRRSSGFYNGATVLNSIDITNPLSGSRFSFSATTTVFLVGRANFGTSTMSAYGGIFARRMR